MFYDICMQQQEQLLICFTTENSESNNLAELLEESFKIRRLGKVLVQRVKN